MESETDTPTDDALGTDFARRLDESPRRRRELLLELVRAETAAVLGHDAGEPVAPDSVFFDIGLVSLTAVELRDRLQTATGLELPTLLVFDRPTPEELAAHLAELLFGTSEEGN